MTSGSAPSDPLGVPTVINGAGKMTYLGASTLHETVVEAMSAAATNHVDMALLMRSAGARIAELAGAPAAWVTASAAAGVVQTVAGAITGTDLALVEAVPDRLPDRREVVLMKGHAIHFGAHLTQMLRMGGASVREVGTATESSGEQIRAAAGRTTAAIVFVVSHHVTTLRQPTLREVVEIGDEAGIPVIVDAAADVDLRHHLDAGASAVVYSGHKAVGGPTSGFVVGTTETVEACAAQQVGVGRAMKVSKETIAGLVVALERFASGASIRDESEMTTLLKSIECHLIGRIPADLSIVTDADRPIPRLRLSMHPGARMSATDLAHRLEHHEPSVRTRNHRVESGIIDIDPRELTAETAQDLAAIVLKVTNQVTRGA
ncbi:MAG: SelA-like pyridoxal phosphate-dependent enzyme [Actinomycetota bacterium]